MAKKTHLSATIFRLRASAYAVASSLVLAASPLVAHGAGLGKVTVLSALGQPLRAEVEVFATREELAGMKAQLASQDAFKQAGVDFASSLNGISFTLSKRANGQTVIKLSSDRPVNDPFVDLLLEVNWATGRLLREYTFLLDPPEFAARIAAAAPAVAKPVASARPPQEETSGPADRPARSERYRARQPAPLQRPMDNAGGYEVRRGETLSQIAGALRPDGVSLDQMLMGLFRANEGAFDRGNINRLKAGRILAIPDKATLEAIPREEARKVVLAQSSDWGGYRQRLAGTAAEAPVFDEMPRQQAAGRVTTRVEDKAAPYADSKDQLKVSRTDLAAVKPPSTAKRTDEELIAKEKALKDANERLASLERNVAELQRLVELKSRSLAELERQSGNKAPLPVDGSKPAADAAAVPAVAAPVAPGPAPAPPGKTEPIPAASPSALAKPADQSVAQPADVKPAEVAVAPPTVPPEAAKPAEPPKPPPEPPKPKPVPPPPPPPDEPGFLSELLGSPSFLAGGGGVIALLAAYWFAKRRRETAADRSFEPSSTLTPQSDNLVANSVFRSTGGQSVDTSHSMAQTDFSQAGPGSIDTDEVDPVAEADVYMAYGRDAQAEEILLEAKQKDPRRYAIHLKLLEIYLGRKDIKPFDALAVEVFSATGGQGPDWEKVVTMGLQIGSQNPLFAGSGQALPVDSQVSGGETTLIVRPGGVQDTVTRPGELSRIAEAAAATERTIVVPSGDEKTRLQPTDLTDLDFDLGSSHTQLPVRDDIIDPSLEKTMAYPSPGRGEALDFDLGTSMPSAALPPVGVAEATVSPDDMYPPEITMLVAPPPSPPPVLSAGASALDFEFDLGADWSTTAGADTQTGAAEEPDRAQDLSSPAGEALDFDVKLTESTVLGQAMQRPSFDLSSLSLDLDEVDVSDKPVAAAAGSKQALESSFEEEQEDTLVNAGFAVEHADTVVNPEVGTQPDLAEELEISSSEEVSTKIDLAKAYQEMGDLEGARELLQEVLKDGDAGQRRTAQALLAGLRE